MAGSGDCTADSVGISTIGMLGMHGGGKLLVIGMLFGFAGRATGWIL